MLIDDPEDFKTWLTAILEPLCDADPAALAKYVYALVKKDKPITELHESMTTQLQVFLQKETESFVSMLIEKLKSDAEKFQEKTLLVKSESILDSLISPIGHSAFIASGEQCQSEKELSSTEIDKSTEPEWSKESEVEKPTQEKDVDESLEKDVRERERDREIREKEREKNNEHNRDAEKQLPSVQLSNEESITNGQPASTLGSVIQQNITRRDDRRSPLRSRDRNKSDSEKDDKGSRSTRQSRRASSPRLRSRSRSWEQRNLRRSRSRDRERDRSRAWRNKSPPSRRYERERRRSWTKTPPRARTRSRSRSRSPLKFRFSRYRNRSPPSARSRSRSRSRSSRDRELRYEKDHSKHGTMSPSSKDLDKDVSLLNLSTSLSSVVSSVKDQSYNSKVRCRDFDEKGFCMRGELCPFDHGVDPVVLEDVALPQVLSSYQGNSIAALPNSSANLISRDCLRPQVNLPVQQTSLSSAVMAQIIRPPLPRPQTNSAEYNPDAPSMEPRMWGRPPFRASSVYASYLPQHQRELINVPVADGSSLYKRPSDLLNDVNSLTSTMKRHTNFEFTRLMGVHRGILGASKIPNARGTPLDNCSLELKKIPHGVNNITHLNNHFAKFGKIVNIQVCFEGDPEAALITFSSHAEANAAYKSTEAVLNNRFIKVFWHNESKQENVPPRRPSVKERLGAPVITPTPMKVLNTLQPSAVQANEEKSTNDKVVYSGNTLTKTMYIPTALKKSENLKITTILSQDEKQSIIRPAVLKKTQEIRAAKETIKKKVEEKRKEVIKLTADLRKRKQDLLDKQLKEQKSLIEKLESGAILPEKKQSVMNTLKVLQETIEKTRKDLAGVLKANTAKTQNVKITPEMVKKTREETQRQILDVELDIFNQQQEGKDTADLQKKVLQLKQQAKSLGFLKSNGTVASHFTIRGKYKISRGCSRGSPRGRGRGSGRVLFNTHASVDHRPTKLIVSGFESINQSNLLAHFAQFGEIEEYEFNDKSAQLTLTYKSRKEAEAALSKGQKINNKQLSISWFSENQVSQNENQNVHRSIVLMCSEGEDVGEEEIDNEYIVDGDEDVDVLQLEEELNKIFPEEDPEEEDAEERSWRR